MRKTTYFLFLLVAACANPQVTTIDKTFNTGEVPGLVALGESYAEAEIDYDLDGRSGQLLHFASCIEVDGTPEEDVVPSQYPLYLLLQLNCQAIELYHQASASRQTHFPQTLSQDFIRELPAIAVPDLGGQSLEGLKGTLGEANPGMTVTEVSANNAKVVIGDLDIDYIVLARADFDNDGLEDMLIRLDWSVMSAFGNGFDLLMLSADDSGIDVKRRY